MGKGEVPDAPASHTGPHLLSPATAPHSSVTWQPQVKPKPQACRGIPPSRQDPGGTLIPLRAGPTTA